MGYVKVREQTAEKMGGFDSQSPCMVCGSITPTKTLTDFGARCFPCFQAYCREPQRPVERSRAALAIRAEILAMGKRVSS